MGDAMGWAHTLRDCRDPSDWAYCTCAVYSCGYSQPHRDWLSVERLEAGTAETDCSYGVGWWLYKGGHLDENPGFSTRDMASYLEERGYEVIDANAGYVRLERNDVLLRTGHTALYIGDGMQAEALRDENHAAGYEGTTPGDQDGGETMVRPLTFDWDYVIRRPRPGEADTDRGDCMTFLFTCDGTHANHVYLYDGLQVHQVATNEQQEVVRDAYRKCTGRDIPMFHLPGGDHLIALAASGPVT